ERRYTASKAARSPSPIGIRLAASATEPRELPLVKLPSKAKCEKTRRAPRRRCTQRGAALQTATKSFGRTVRRIQCGGRMEPNAAGSDETPPAELSSPANGAQDSHSRISPSRLRSLLVSR